MWGRGGATQGFEKTTMIWDELNTSFIPNSKPINSFMIVSFYRDQYKLNKINKILSNPHGLASELLDCQI